MTTTKRLSWICIVNQREGRLLRAREIPEHRHQLKLKARIENKWEEHEHGRPSPLAAKNGHTHSSYGHESETMRRRFAQDVADWLESNARTNGIDRVAVLAPSRFLAELKPRWSTRLQSHVEEYECGLGYLEEGELVQHPMIIRLLSNGNMRL
ncbi:MAG: host attachment protein [Planctomycetota bacterium]|nr:host attachment protein [Planctomycetota bacterium]